MFSITGSTMKHATSFLDNARSKASASLNGITIVSRTTASVTPALDGTDNGLSAGPAKRRSGFCETITTS